MDIANTLRRGLCAAATGAWRRRGVRSRFAWGLGALALASTAAAEPTVIHTTKTQFQIPFEFEADRLAEVGGREVVLFVSRDGAEWTRGGQSGLSDAFVGYAADDDGRYLFALRVRTDQNTLIPAGPMRPSLTVVVDRTAPTLAVSLLSAGQRPRVVWHSDDPHLDPATLRMEYSRDGATWRPLDVAPAASGQAAAPETVEGQTLLVRAEIADAAGNVGRATASARVQSAARVIAEAAAEPEAAAPAGGLPQIRPGKVEDRDAVIEELTGRPVAAAPMQPLRPVASPTLPAPTLPSLPTPIVPTPQQAMVASHAAPRLPRPSEPLASPMTAEAPPQAYDMQSRLGLDGVVRVNTLAFGIEYALQQVGHSGVRQVDAYITEDDGGRWFYFGRDADAVSPLDITVPREGRYGFAFRVQNGAGVAMVPPQPGDRPDVRVEVDTTAPTIAGLAATPSPQTDGELLIQWQASDRQLAETPIALSWAATPDGPWAPLAGGLENAGSHRWQVPATIPPAVHIRIEVADACGNIATRATPQPVVVDFSRPSLKVLGVR